MNLQEAFRTIYNLQEKIIILESIRTIIPIFISLIAAAFAIWTFFFNRKSKKRDLLRFYISEFNNSKVSTEEIGIKMAPLLGKKQTATITPAEEAELNILNTTLESRNEKVLNVIENACTSYYIRELVKKEFTAEFFEDVKLFVETHQTKYTPPVTSYPKTVKYYTEICKRQK